MSAKKDLSLVEPDCIRVTYSPELDVVTLIDLRAEDGSCVSMTGHFLVNIAARSVAGARKERKASCVSKSLTMASP